MKKAVILLTAETVSAFVNAANDCPFDIDVANVKSERSAVDAKSIMGVMALDFNREIVVMYDGENEKFEAVLEKLKAPQGKEAEQAAADRETGASAQYSQEDRRA